MPKKQETKKESEKKEAQKKEISKEEFEKKVLELADKGLTSERIGEMLRREGIHPSEHGKKISKILKERGKYVVPEIKNVEEKLKGIVKHYENNKQDKRAMREKDRIFAKLRVLKSYHKVA